MESVESRPVKEERNNRETKEYDPTLDFFSKQFDPLKALTTPGVSPPVINAMAYDNLSKYNSAQTDPARQQVIQAGSSKNVPTENFQRKWLPHQMPIQTERRTLKNVITKMETIKGPLELLKKCKDEHTRIKVYTRHSHAIRGYCIAFVTVFDKHWNLVLEDVTEVWTRPKRRKIPAGLGNSEDVTISSKRLRPPPTKIVKSDKKTETCERYIDQLLIRGEQIAIIVALQSTSSEISS